MSYASRGSRQLFDESEDHPLDNLQLEQTEVEKLWDVARKKEEYEKQAPAHNLGQVQQQPTKAIPNDQRAIQESVAEVIKEVSEDIDSITRKVQQRGSNGSSMALKGSSAQARSADISSAKLSTSSTTSSVSSSKQEPLRAGSSVATQVSTPRTISATTTTPTQTSKSIVEQYIASQNHSERSNKKPSLFDDE